MSQESQEKPGGNTKTPGPLYQHYRWIVVIPMAESSASQLSQVFKGFCKEFCFSGEKGEKSGYEHWQCCISLKNKEYFGTVKNLIGFSSAHIEECKHWFKAKNYCKKEETHICGPYDEKSVFLKQPFDGIKPFPFQQEIIDLISGTADDRTIHWYWEPNGKVGKTTLAKHLCMNHTGVVFVSGKASDIKFAISRYLEKNTLTAVIFHFTRTNEEYVSYEAIESIKDGIFFSGKYESGMCVFNNPHVICLANFEPDTNCMSIDRWSIKKIESNELVLTTHTARRLPASSAL